MKKILKVSTSLMLAVVLMLSLAGCGEVKKAETAVNNMFKAFKELNFDEAQKYVDMEDFSSGSGMTDNAEMFMENLFDKLEYEIVSSEKVDSENVNVKTKITAIDMKPVMKDFFTAALEYAFANAMADPQPTEEEMQAKMEEILVECTSKPDLENLTKEVEIKVVKQDDEWKVQTDEEFVNAVLGDLEAAAQEIQNSYNSEE